MRANHADVKETLETKPNNHSPRKKPFHPTTRSLSPARSPVAKAAKRPLPPRKPFLIPRKPKKHHEKITPDSTPERRNNDVKEMVQHREDTSSLDIEEDETSIFQDREEDDEEESAAAAAVVVSPSPLHDYNSSQENSQSESRKVGDDMQRLNLMDLHSPGPTLDMQEDHEDEVSSSPSFPSAPSTAVMDGTSHLERSQEIRAPTESSSHSKTSSSSSSYAPPPSAVHGSLQFSRFNYVEGASPDAQYPPSRVATPTTGSSTPGFRTPYHSSFPTYLSDLPHYVHNATRDLEIVNRYGMFYAYGTVTRLFQDSHMEPNLEQGGVVSYPGVDPELLKELNKAQYELPPLSQLLGPNHMLSLLSECVGHPLQNPHLYPAHAPAPLAFCLYGPAGSGKRTTVLSYARNRGINVLQLKEFYSEPKMMESVLAFALNVQPCIVYFDACDGMFSHNPHGKGSWVYELLYLLIQKDTEKDFRGKVWLSLGMEQSVSTVEKSFLKHIIKKHFAYAEPPADTDIDIFTRRCVYSIWGENGWGPQSNGLSTLLRSILAYASGNTFSEIRNYMIHLYETRRTQLFISGVIDQVVNAHSPLLIPTPELLKTECDNIKKNVVRNIAGEDTVKRSGNYISGSYRG